MTVGERVSIQSGVYLAAASTVGDDVFIGPGVTFTNDRLVDGSGTPLQGPVLADRCRIGGGAVLLPGVKIGADAFVAAGAVVTSDLPARKLAIGVPARVSGDAPPRQI